MTFLTRFEPFREFASLQNQMNRMLREEPLGGEESLLQTRFAPPVDIYEDEHSYMLKLEVPGIDEKDVDDKGLLKVRLATKAEARPKQIKVTIGRQIEVVKGKAA